MAELPRYMRAAPISDERVDREVLSSHQRDRVLDHATDTFARRGYGGTTVDDLLAAGRIGVGNFYSLFEGKEDCFVAAFERSVGLARRRIADAAEDGEDWGERAWLGLRALIASLFEAPLGARLVLIEAQSAGPVALVDYNSLLDEAIAWIGGARGRYRLAADLPRGFERSVVSGLAYYLQQCLLDLADHEPGPLFAEVADVLLGPVLGAVELRRLNDSLAAVSA